MPLPGGELSNRPLHFIWILDVSGSMANSKIQQLNFAIKNALPEMVKVADENPNARVLVRAVKFSNGAAWHVPTPTEIDKFQWRDLSAGGVTDMGKALRLVADQLKMPPMETRALPPVLVLVSDGQPTDDFRGGLKALMDEPWGKKSVRVAIAIGGDADTSVLKEFIGNHELQPLVANNSADLVNYIKWASTLVLQSSIAPSSQTTATAASGAVQGLIPPAPKKSDPSNATDVW